MNAGGATRAAIANGSADGISENGILFDIKRFAIHDGPGIRTTVFFKGCPLACRWCHNPESQRREPELFFWAERCRGCGSCVSTCPIGAIALIGGVAATDRERCDGCGLCAAVCPEGARVIAGKSWSVERVLDLIEKDVLFYDESGGGVTLSGGEPLAQVKFAVSLLRACRERRIHTALDTCGQAEWDDVEALAGLTDLFLFDVKLIDDARHRGLTGVSNRLILENLRRLDREGHRIWIRYPLVPGLNDAGDDIAALGRFVAGLRSVEAVYVLPFHRGGESKRRRLERTEPPLCVDVDARSAAEEAAETLRGMLEVPVETGG